MPSRGPRGIPLLVVAITLDCRCNCREFSFEADCCGLQWKLPSINEAIAVNCGRNCRGNYRRLSRSAEMPWQLPRTMLWQSPRNAVVYRGNCRRLPLVKITGATAVECGNCRGNCRGWPRNAVVFRGNCNGLTSVEIAVAIALECRGNYRVLSWHLPWEDSRGNYRGMPWPLPLIAVDCRGN